MENSNLLGMLLPMLMSGAGIGDIFRTLGGAGQGGATMDGLRAMISQSMSNARRQYPIIPNGNTLNRAFETVVHRLGGDPYNGVGQGAVSLLRSVYNLSPDLVGGMIGVPNAIRMFGMLSNGAGGISMAGGFGLPDFANPYSVMNAHRRAMNLGRMVQEFSSNGNGGYNVDFTGGLNMEEVGKVSQRLLSSRIAYTEAVTGHPLNPEDEGTAERFKENLKKLGAKFNETVSMLSKVTGSVDEALNVMDRLGGGNFLGGTAEEASDIARRAKRMAANIRVTSAMAGMSPTEMYSRMSGLQTSMSGGMGMNAYIAGASGFSGLMWNMAYNAMMGYGAWAAVNPNASKQEKDTAMLAVIGRAQAYSSSNGARLASLVADNRHLFTDDQINQIMRAYESGRPDDVADMIRSVVGNRLYTEHMQNASMNVAARNRVSKSAEGRRFMEEIDSRGLAGNLEQAEQVGASRMLNIYTRDLDDSLMKRAGDGNYNERRNDAVKKAFVKKVVESKAMTEEQANGYSLDQLREFMIKRFDGSEIERLENNTRIAESRRQIAENTMSTEDERAAIGRLKAEMDRMGITESEQKYILEDGRGNKRGGGASLELLLSHAKTNDERERIRATVTGGKYFADEAKKEQSKFDEIEKHQRTEYSAEERVAAIEKDLNSKVLSQSMDLKGKAANSKDLFDAYFKANGGKDEFHRMQRLAATAMVKEFIGENLGSIKDTEENKALSSLISGIVGEGDEILGIGGGTKEELIRRLRKEKDAGEKDDETKKAIDSVIDKLEKGSYDASDRSMNMRVAGYVDESRKDSSAKAVSRLKEMAKDDFNGMMFKDDINALFESLEGTGGFNKEQLEKLKAEALKRFDEGANEEGKNENAGDIARWVLSELQGKGLRKDSYFGITATGSADKAGVLMAALIYKSMGGDVKAFKDQLGLSDEAVDAIMALDKSNANASMNAVSNFWGGGGFAQDAVKYTEKRIDELREKLKGTGIDAAVLKGASEGNGDAVNKVKSALKGPTADMDFALIKTVAGGGGDYEKALYKSLTEGDKTDLESLKKDKDKYNEGMLDVARKSGQNDSKAYELMNSLGGFINQMSMFFRNPDQIFNVHVKSMF